VPACNLLLLRDLKVFGQDAYPGEAQKPPLGASPCMRRDLRNRRILITGASRGIGASLAEQLTAAGARLALVARSAERLQQQADRLARQQGAEVVALPADLTRAEDRERLLEAVVRQFGGLDVLINNAGVASWAHFAESSEQVLRQVVEVNFFAPAELTRLAI